MGEPVILYNRDGESVTVYSVAQAAEMRRLGAWYSSPEEAQAAADAMAAKMAPKTAAQVVAEDDAPKVARQPAAQPAKPTRGKGKGI